MGAIEVAKGFVICGVSKTVCEQKEWGLIPFLYLCDFKNHTL